MIKIKEKFVKYFMWISKGKKIIIVSSHRIFILDTIFHRLFITKNSYVFMVEKTKTFHDGYN